MQNGTIRILWDKHLDRTKINEKCQTHLIDLNNLIGTLAFLQDSPGFQKSGSQDDKKIVQALQAGF